MMKKKSSLTGNQDEHLSQSHFNNAITGIFNQPASPICINGCSYQRLGASRNIKSRCNKQLYSHQTYSQWILYKHCQNHT